MSSSLAKKLEEKQHEYASVCNLRDLSRDLADRFEKMAVKLESLSNGTEAVASVLDNWKEIFQTIRLASSHAGTLVRIPQTEDIPKKANE
ncbi:DASH complex subunit Dad2 [Schizosaccharomyces japonicus yFS275]|uniref:DASH complex subunit DAD2 n=1 Tax=Schizosaccharomyces japonicus (strain yFS275 / FY16936) TaxID=402676 RepID=B6K0H8_SCHJY|nr:DASH complex subunit Dad2 [Schizosaccharomyces japonicus yFS275]EEB06328.1 DASH complex subunit Dad2 [Schizosaccharomyces japonicus yFS275]